MTTLRRDARANRERLIEAARAAFAERGLDVPLDEIARRAGVSIGTLYNRFPSRAALAEAVFADREETVVRIAEHALSMDSAWDGLVHLIEQVGRLMAADRGYNDLTGRRAGPPRGHALMSALVARAQENGELRADFTLTDMAFVVWSLTGTIRATATEAPDAWRRHLAFMLDGLRAPAARPVPARPLPAPPLTDEQVARIMSGACPPA
ncbi:helix-turn-helix domain-containing protein [Actinoplanes sp. NPDC051633]|uniref:TetR/AcrR family transcriptional regulator n=1 Tax=Actinoplanes sp. NPDC051633 TaxID=3155670 RepID=UPI0034417B5D